MQRDNLSESEINQVKDQVWQQMVTNHVLEADAKKVGLTVTEQELQNVLNEGTDPMLSQTPFINQQTGRFDVNALKQFIDAYNKAKTANPQQAEQMKTAYNYWMFVKRTSVHSSWVRSSRLSMQAAFSLTRLKLNLPSTTRTKKHRCSWLQWHTLLWKMLTWNTLTKTWR